MDKFSSTNMRSFLMPWFHAHFPTDKELYDLQEAAFLSNVGSLAEPLSKEQWDLGAGQRCTGLFSHSDQQQAAQTLTCQYSGSSQKGAGGRIAVARLVNDPFWWTLPFGGRCLVTFL